MADARGIRAGAAYVELFVSDNKLVRGLERASRRLSAFGAAVRGMGAKLAGIGAAMLTPILALSSKFSETADDLMRISRRTGIAVETLSELSYAAKLADTDMESLEKSIRLMQRTIVQAADGSDSAVAALATLGLTVKDLKGLTPDEQFKLIADRLSQIESPAARVATAMAIFGRSAANILPLMTEGAKGIEAMQKEARDLGLTMSTETAAAGERFHETLKALKAVLAKTGGIIGSAVAPMLRELAERIVKIMVAGNQWLKKNQSLVISVTKVAAGVLASGAALVTLGHGITAIGKAFGGISAIITSVGSAVGIVGSTLAAILSPIGLVSAAVVGLGAYILYATDLGGRAIAWLVDRFGELRDFASRSVQGIADALAAGDIALAAKALWLSLKIVWQNGVAELQMIWLTLSGFLVKAAYGAFYGVLAASELMWHGMKVAWIEGVAFLRQLWTEFTTWHAKAVEATADAMVKAWIWAREKTGAITPDQAAFERNYSQKQHESQSQQIEADRQWSLDQVERDRASSRQVESQRHEQRLAEVGQGYQGIADAVEAERAEKIRATESALAAARKEWQDAIAEAKQKRQDEDASAPPRLGRPQSIQDYLEGLDGAILDAKKTITVSGTFNAMEAPGLAGGGVTDRIASATEATARNTKKLLDRAKDGMAFE